MLFDSLQAGRAWEDHFETFGGFRAQRAQRASGLLYMAVPIVTLGDRWWRGELLVYPFFTSI